MNGDKEWIEMVKGEVDKVIEDSDPREAYNAISHLEETIKNGLLYIRQKRIAHANKHGFKHK